MKKELSRQRQYQLRHAKAGLCLLCSKEADRRGFCRSHWESHLVRSRENRRKKLGCIRRNLNSLSYQLERERELVRRLAVESGRQMRKGERV